MDTAEQLACDLSVAHPLLASRWGWRRTIGLAAEGSNTHLCALAGTVFADRALGVVADLREAREHARSRGNSGTTAHPASTPSVSDLTDGDQPSPQPLALVWDGDDCVLDVDEIAHAATLRPSIAVGQ